MATRAAKPLRSDLAWGLGLTLGGALAVFLGSRIGIPTGGGVEALAAGVTILLGVSAILLGVFLYLLGTRV